MTERQFNELRRYREAEGSCISDFSATRPLESLISSGWVTEVVRDCWGITAKGAEAFDAVVQGTSELQPDRQGA